MGENKGHGTKKPDYPELDDMGSAANRAGNLQGSSGQQDIGNQQSDQQQIGQQGSMQQGKKQGNKQQDVGSQSDTGNQQQGLKQSQQKGGQHASGGTPALDDLNDKSGNLQSGSLGSASGSDWQQQQEKDR